MSEQQIPLHLLAAFQQFYPNLSPEWLIKAPDHEVWAAAALGDAQAFHVVNAARQARTTFSWQSAKIRQTVFKRPLPDWARYPAGVIYHLYGAGLEQPGLYAAVLSNESFGPREAYGSGIAFAQLWYTVNQAVFTPDLLREVVEKVRRDYVESL